MVERIKIYVGGLSDDTTDNDLHKIFSKHDGFLEVNLVKDRRTQQSKGFAFISFDCIASAKMALCLNQEKINGKTIKVCLAKTDREDLKSTIKIV